MKIASVLVIIVGTTIALSAQPQPFQASLTPDVAIYERTEEIQGLTLSVWGENPQTGLALGIVNGSTGDSAGFSYGLLLNYSEDYTGIQFAPANYSDGSVKGLQIGFVNYAQALEGVQFGIVNFLETADTAIQIGILNVIRETTTWFDEFPDAVAPGMIFVNWRF